MIDFTRIIDFASIGALTWLIHKVAPIKSPGDFLGTAMVSFMVYALFKAPYLLFMGGFTFPVTKDPVVHLTSGLLAVPTALFVVGCIAYIKCLRRNRL